MSSKNRSQTKEEQKPKTKPKPRLSVAIDTTPTTADQVAPPTEVSVEAPVEQASEPVDATPAAVERAAPAAESKPSARSARAAKPRAAAPKKDADPLVQELNGRVYVQVGEDLMPEGARVQMTIALTAMERHRWSRYAEARRMPMIDVLREQMASVFSGDDD